NTVLPALNFDFAETSEPDYEAV
ncbi:MAG TPA: fumarylacetoacetase, partial [Acinetobacter nosocomialis]|nr:fumarylacetoacetase [Acinetobacter nosocomialis]